MLSANLPASTVFRIHNSYDFENSQFILHLPTELKCVSILLCVVFRLVYPHILFLQQNIKITILLIFKNNSVSSSFLVFQQPIAKCLHNCMGWETLLCTLSIDYKGGIWCVRCWPLVRKLILLIKKKCTFGDNLGKNLGQKP